MKFTNGQWLGKAGYTFLHPIQVFDHSFSGDCLTVYAYTRPAPGRAQTIDQGTITLRLTAPQTDAVAVKLSHYDGVKVKTPEFDLNKTHIKAEFSEDENTLRFCSGKLTAVITKDIFKLDYYYDGKRITGSAAKASGNITTEDGDAYMREQLGLSVGECVYGLGERFTPFVKNGQVVDIWNEDGGTASELSYKNIPFYITSNNYGVLVNHTEKVSFEIASEQVERVQFSCPGQSLEYIIFGGGDLKQVLSGYASLTGKPALPPDWSFGLWLSTSFTTDYDEKTVTSFLDGMRDRDIPLTVIHFDCFWMKAAEWSNFTWNPETFPDPAAMLQRYHDRGLKVCVWINSYIAQKSPLFAEAMAKGFLVMKPDGDVWQWDRWQAGMGLVDFTNPDACEWYQSKLKALLDMGVDCFKTDFGERIPTDVVWYDGSDPQKMHNYYTYLYNKCVFDLLKAEKGESEAVVFARSATVGGQQFPVHWGGDCWGTYESMAESLRGGLSLCMSGFGFWSHDIGGFENTSTPDLYKRWVAFGLLSTHSRLHGSTSYRVPWLFDEESVDVLRHFVKLRKKLMPYLLAQAKITAETGVPMLRSMVLEFPDDHVCRTLDTQYMLGGDLLVAPIFNSEGIASYYLPEGAWRNVLTGETRAGGKYYSEKHDYFSLPLYAKANSEALELLFK